MTPLQFRLVMTPGLILVAFFFGIAGLLMFFIPYTVYSQIRLRNAPAWQALFLAICSLYLIAELVLLFGPGSH